MLIVGAVPLPLGLWLVLSAQRIPPAAPVAAPGSRSRRAVWRWRWSSGRSAAFTASEAGPFWRRCCWRWASRSTRSRRRRWRRRSSRRWPSSPPTEFYKSRTIAPDWTLAAFLGAGRFAGSYLDARCQRHVPELALRRLLGVLACAAAARYSATAVQPSAPERPCAPGMNTKECLAQRSQRCLHRRPQRAGSRALATEAMRFAWRCDAATFPIDGGGDTPVRGLARPASGWGRGLIERQS